MNPYLAVLQIQPFRRLWLAQIASQIAVNVMAFVLTIQIYEVTRSNTAVSFLVLAIGLPALLLGSVAGVFVDYWNKRHVLFWCNIIRAIFVASLFFFHESLPTIYISAIVISIVTQFFVPAEGPLIPQFVPAHLLLPANSLFTFTYFASVAAGFISSGPLLILLGPQGIFLFIAFFLLVAGWFCYRIPKEKDHQVPREIKLAFSTFSQELHYGFSYLKSHKRVMEALLLFTASQAFLTTLAALAPGFADRVLLIELTDASVIVMGPALAGLIITTFFLGIFSSKVDKNRLISIGIFGVSIVLLILSLFIRIGNRPHLMESVERWLPLSLQLQRLDVALVLFFLLGAFNSAIIVPLNAILQNETEESVRGRVYGILSALSGGVSVLPVVGFATLADYIGVGKTIFALSASVFVFGLWRSFLRRLADR